MKERVVGMAEWAVDRGDVDLVAVGLGSCVAVALYDPDTRVGGLLHLLLPSPAQGSDPSNAARFAETGIPLLLREVVAAGAKPERLAARLAGGASLFGRPGGGGPVAMGDRNVAAARQALARAYVPIAAEAVLGHHGRSVRFHLSDGAIDVGTVGHGSLVI